MVTFIGIDLAWQSDKNHSGIAVLQGNEAGAKLACFSNGIDKLCAVQEFLTKHTTANTVIAIDAPLIITNPTGQRVCENEVSRRFGYAHASAHTSNLKRDKNPRSVQFSRDLVALGFTHATTPAHDRRREGHWFFEVYPHPAQVMLFQLSQIIKYKKGNLQARRTGLQKLRWHITHDLVQATPALQMTDQLDQLLNRDLETLTGKELKHYEDTLDALVCAYLAMWYWTWGDEKTEMIGNVQEGYIINPTTHA